MEIRCDAVGAGACRGLKTMSAKKGLKTRSLFQAQRLVVATWNAAMLCPTVCPTVYLLDLPRVYTPLHVAVCGCVAVWGYGYLTKMCGMGAVVSCRPRLQGRGGWK